VALPVPRRFGRVGADQVGRREVVSPSRLSARVTAEVPLRYMPGTTTPDLSCAAMADRGGGAQGAAIVEVGARPASGTASARNTSLTL
jgi:hypothetical protein